MVFILSIQPHFYDAFTPRINDFKRWCKYDGTEPAHVWVPKHFDIISDFIDTTTFHDSHTPHSTHTFGMNPMAPSSSVRDSVKRYSDGESYRYYVTLRSVCAAADRDDLVVQCLGCMQRYEYAFNPNDDDPRLLRPRNPTCHGITIGLGMDFWRSGLPYSFTSSPFPSTSTSQLVPPSSTSSDVERECALHTIRSPQGDRAPRSKGAHAHSASVLRTQSPKVINTSGIQSATSFQRSDQSRRYPEYLTRVMPYDPLFPKMGIHCHTEDCQEQKTPDGTWFIMGDPQDNQSHYDEMDNRIKQFRKWYKYEGTDPAYVWVPPNFDEIDKSIANTFFVSPVPFCTPDRNNPFPVMPSPGEIECNRLYSDRCAKDNYSMLQRVCTKAGRCDLMERYTIALQRYKFGHQ
jgi:hypothetical protein